MKYILLFALLAVHSFARADALLASTFQSCGLNGLIDLEKFLGRSKSVITKFDKRPPEGSFAGEEAWSYEHRDAERKFINLPENKVLAVLMHAHRGVIVEIELSFAKKDFDLLNIDQLLDRCAVKKIGTCRVLPRGWVASLPSSTEGNAIKTVSLSIPKLYRRLYSFSPNCN